MFDDQEIGFIIFVIVLIIAAMIFLPLLAIWSVNTLFGTSIVFTIKTWFASLVLVGIVGGTSVSYES